MAKRKGRDEPTKKRPRGGPEAPRAGRRDGKGGPGKKQAKTETKTKPKPKPNTKQISAGRLRTKHVGRDGVVGKVRGGGGKRVGSSGGRDAQKGDRHDRRPGGRRVGQSKGPARDALGRFKKKPRRPASPPKKTKPKSKLTPRRAPAKPVRRAPAKKPRKPQRPRRPGKPRKSVEPKGPSKRRRPPTKKIRPNKPLPATSEAAEKNIQEFLGHFMDGIVIEVPTLDINIKTFINSDLTVDGETRMANLPEDWRTEEGIPMMMEILSRVLGRLGLVMPGDEGGAYWISIGVRFGPQSDAELGDLAEMYKRFRGMVQVSSYPTSLSIPSGAQNAIVAFGSITRAFMTKHGLPPAVVFVRVTWMPDGSRPGQYEGEKGGGR